MICWMKFWTTSLIRCHPSCARLGSSNVCTTNNYSLPPHFGEVLANQSISYGNCKSTIIVMMTQLTPMMYMYYGNSTDWINGSRSPGCQILKLRAGFIYYVELGGSARKNKVRWPPAKRPQQHIDGLCIKKIYWRHLLILPGPVNFKLLSPLLVRRPPVYYYKYKMMFSSSLTTITSDFEPLVNSEL